MKIDYCSRDYSFANKAYIAIIWAIDDNDQMMTVLSSQLHKSKTEMESYIKGIAQIMAKRKSKVEKVNIIEIVMMKLWKNKKEYWTAVDGKEKIKDGTMAEKISWLSPFLKSPKLYDLLIVPRTEM